MQAYPLYDCAERTMYSKQDDEWFLFVVLRVAFRQITQYFIENSGGC